MYYKKLVGNKVYLSPMDIDYEVPMMTKFMNEDMDIAYFNGFYDSLLGEDKVRELLMKWNEGPFAFSIIEKDTNAFMGHVSMFNADSHQQYITLGIYIAEQYRGRGYGKEAMQLAIDYAFNTQRYHTIHLEVFAYNTKALEIYKKLGFKECGRWHKARYHMGESHDIIMMELFREDWK